MHRTVSLTANGFKCTVCGLGEWNDQSSGFQSSKTIRQIFFWRGKLNSYSLTFELESLLLSDAEFAIRHIQFILLIFNCKLVTYLVRIVANPQDWHASASQIFDVEFQKNQLAKKIALSFQVRNNNVKAWHYVLKGKKNK